MIRAFHALARTCCPECRSRRTPADWPARTLFHAALILGFGWLGLVRALAAPVDFVLPAQPADEALLAFSQQAHLEVLFSFDDLHPVTSTAVRGRYEPAEALVRLLDGTGFTARRNDRGKFVVTSTARPTGALQGRLLLPGGAAAPGATVALVGTHRQSTTDTRGNFTFPTLAPGSYHLVATCAGYRPLEVVGVLIENQRTFVLEPQTLQPRDELTKLEPYIVQGRSAGLRPFDHSQTLGTTLHAAGNLDLPRSENGALPYTIYDRDQIARSGVVDLNEFLQRELLESDAATRPPGSGSAVRDFITGSTNLNLRGFGADETVILVNGRRVPELLVTGAESFSPDVNLIPLSLVQQIDVLPVSASSLYSGNAVGGVINIILRPEPDANVTELTTTHTNALRGFDAPQSALSLVHSHTLLDGRLRLRLHASLNSTTPPTEAELHLRQARGYTIPALTEAVHRATPNIRSADGSPLFGTGTASVTSVAPGANGTGGLAAFAGRQGLRNYALFDSPGQLSISSDSLDFPYGLRQRRWALAGSAVFDALPWLQFGADGAWSRTVINRGLDVFRADLTLSAANTLNPFGQEVQVALNETAPGLGENYSEAHIDSYSGVLGVLVKFPSDWRLALDSQYARNTVRYRGLSGTDGDRWQQLVDTGAYNPLRDTQVYGPPAAFYDQVLLYLGGRNRFVTLGDYETLDAALRLTNQALTLPTGPAVLNIGSDYRRNHLAAYTDEARYADGTLYDTPTRWSGRTLQRYSGFTELQAPLLPARWLPRWLKALEADLAVRYVASADAKESNTAPTLGLKAETAAGLTFRGSFTTSSRIPTPQMTLKVNTSTGGGGANYTSLYDPIRNETYDIQVNEDLTPPLVAEDSVTQHAGLVYLHGRTHRLRAALDYVDTRKTNEVVVLEAKDVISLESVLPGRVTRTTLASGDTHSVGRITSVLTGAVNTDLRHSQSWNSALDYTWTECAGGTLELRGRFVWYQRYDRRLFPSSATVDELGTPDGLTSAVLKYRANLGAGWSNRRGGFGTDAHYFHSRVLPTTEWVQQGSDRIAPFWQFDLYAHAEVGRWLPWLGSRYGLRAQFRINNVLGTDYPHYANEGSGSGVQPYGDWRGRTYSLALTTTF